MADSLADLNARRAAVAAADDAVADARAAQVAATDELEVARKEYRRKQLHELAVSVGVGGAAIGLASIAALLFLADFPGLAALASMSALGIGWLAVEAAMPAALRLGAVRLPFGGPSLQKAARSSLAKRNRTLKTALRTQVQARQALAKSEQALIGHEAAGRVAIVECDGGLSLARTGGATALVPAESR